MTFNLKPDEHYMDGKDRWSVHYLTSVDNRSDLGDYTEVIQVFRNGELVGQTLSRKDMAGRNKAQAYQEGMYRIPAAAKQISTEQ
jgi:hypothetical protein